MDNAVGRREGWPTNAQKLEQRLGFRLPDGVEVREDQHFVYVYVDWQAKAVAVLSVSAATHAALAETIQRAIMLRQ